MKLNGITLQKLISFENCTVRSGVNNIQRRSIDSSVTVPFQVSFRNLDEIPLTSQDTADNFIYCGCGWPDHMLIPKGTLGEGLQCDLFVMVTDYQQDRVRRDPFLLKAEA